jgi:hypothetical protein
VGWDAMGWNGMGERRMMMYETLSKRTCDEFIADLLITAQKVAKTNCTSNET